MPQLQDALGNGGTSPGADWFINPIYETMLGLGLAFAIPLTIVGLIASLRSGSFAILGRMVMNLFLAIAISQTAIWVVVLLDNLADDITNWALVKLARQNVDGLVTHLATVFGAAAAGTAFSGAPELIGVILGGAIVLGAVILLIELLMRMVGIYLGLAFVPLAAVGLVNPHTHGWMHRLAQIEIGLIMLKPAIAILLGIGAAMLTASPVSTGPQGDPGLLAFAGGLVVILLTVFTPFYLMKFVPWAEAGISSTVSAKAQSVAAIPLREGTSRLRAAARERFGTRIPGLGSGASKGLPAAGDAGSAGAAAASGGGTVVLQAATVVVRRAGQVPAMATGGRGGSGSRKPVYAAGPPESTVRVIPKTNGATSTNKPPPPGRQPSTTKGSVNPKTSSPAPPTDPSKDRRQ